MGEIFFDAEEDAAELIGALQAEGYTTSLRQEPFAGEDDAQDHGWVLEVEPFDDGVVAMVDVYGGWMPGDPHLEVEDPPDLPDEPRR